MDRVRRLAFRFTFVYFLGNILPWPLGDIGPLKPLARIYGERFTALVSWFGESILGLGRVADHPTGSGDTLFGWVSTLFLLVTSAGIVAIWSTFDRLRSDDRRIADALRVWVRFFLAAMMLSYGLAKVWKAQMPMPWETRLEQPFGAATKMALLWTFMGASTGYTIFAGASETLAGLLLFFRRTTLLGALVAAAVMTNVFVLNLCYDVPVKLFSFLLLLMAVALAAPHFGRLANVLVLNRPAPPAELAPSPNRRVVLARRFVGLAFAIFLVQQGVRDAMDTYVKYGDGSPPTAVYRVEAMEPPLWKTVVLYAEIFNVLDTHDAIERWKIVRNDAAGLFILHEIMRPPAIHAFRVTAPGPDVLILDGTLYGQKMHATLRRYEPAPSRLTSQKLKWIAEYPDNH